MRNGNTLFIVAMVALVVVMVMAQMSMPKRFKWETTFSHNDEQPFGCAVFDSVMAASAPAGFEVTGLTFYQLTDQPSQQRKTMLLAERYWYSDETTLKAIKQLLMRGNNVVLAVYNTYGIADMMEDMFGIQFRNNIDENSDIYNFPRQYADSVRDKVTWMGAGSQSRTDFVFHAEWSIHNVICPDAPQGFEKRGYWKDTKRSVGYRVLAQRGNEYHEIVALSIEHDGWGKLVVTTMPHLFSNYGVLDPQMRTLAMRVLSQAGKRPIVRLDENLGYGSVAEGGASHSPLKYLLDNPPLRWALYLALATVLLFLAFTARRRQRVIPVINPPANQSMALVEHIGTLYYQRHDNADLLHKKYLYFTEHLRRQAVVDIDDRDHLDSELTTLAQLTGLKADQLKSDIGELQAAVQAERLNDTRLKHFINLMNDILERI